MRIKQPWQMTRDEAVLDSRIKLGGRMGNDIARTDPDGRIVLSDDYFDHSEQDREEIWLHEQAHNIESNIAPETKVKLFDNADFMASRGRNINEKLANIIAEGKQLPPEVIADYPELADTSVITGLLTGEIAVGIPSDYPELTSSGSAPKYVFGKFKKKHSKSNTSLGSIR